MSRISTIRPNYADWTKDRLIDELERVRRGAGTSLQTIANASNPDEALFQKIFGAIQNGVVVTDHAKRNNAICYVNAAFERLTGYTAEEVIGRDFRFLQGLDLDRPGLEKFRTALAANQPITAVLRIYRKDGSPFWVQITAGPLRDGAGEARHFISILTDITEHRAAEDALRVSMANLFNLIHGSIQGFLVFRDSIGLFANQALADIFGYDSPQEILHLEDLSLLIVEEERCRLREYQRARMNGEHAPSEYECRGLRKDGSTLCLTTRVWVADWDGKPAIHVSFADITGLKRQQQELKKKSELLQTTLDTMDQGITMVDRDLNVLAYNRRLLEILDIPPEAAEKNTNLEYFLRLNAERGEYGPGDADEQVRERVELAKRFLPHRFERIRPDGTVVEVVGNPMEGGGFVTTYADITEHKRAEEALREAKNAAETANLTKSEFLAHMSHELRTPLNAIIGFSQVMVRGSFGPMGSPKYREYANDILESGRHLLSMISDILDVSKIEAGEIELREAPVSVAAVVDASLRLVRARADKAGVKVKRRIARDLPRLRADETRVRQVLVNLISNAVKFTCPDGNVTVSASCRQDGGLSITVADTGIGIEPDKIPIALTPFKQIEALIARRQEGTGLGLPLSKALVELHDGELTLTSRPGRGTKVAVMFPPERTLPHPKRR